MAFGLRLIRKFGKGDDNPRLEEGSQVGQQQFYCRQESLDADLHDGEFGQDGAWRLYSFWMASHTSLFFILCIAVRVLKKLHSNYFPICAERG